MLPRMTLQVADSTSVRIQPGDISNRFQNAPVVESVHPVQSGVFHFVYIFPGATVANDFSLVQPVDGLSQRIVVGIAHTSDRCFYSCLDQFVAVTDRQVLATPVAEDGVGTGCTGAGAMIRHELRRHILPRLLDMCRLDLEGHFNLLSCNAWTYW